MLSIHFNGEIVRHRDMNLIHRYQQEKNDKENRCKYGIEFLNCNTWAKYAQSRLKVKKSSAYGTCILSGSKDCHCYKQRKDAGNKKKEFSIDWKTYRKVSSAAHYMIKESNYKTVFITLTFPQWKKQHKLTKSFFYDEITNKLFSKFAENLRNNYGCDNYIAVKEYGKRNNRVHFHFIGSMPFISFADLNDSWCHTIQKYCHYSNHALQTDKKSSCVIHSPIRAVRYVCKYVSKSFGQRSGTRIVFISNKTLRPPVKIRENNINHIDILKPFKSIQIKTYDHVTVYKITDYKEFNKFCHLFLYPLYECSVKATNFLYQSAESPP